jgi:hypothetical protein
VHLEANQVGNECNNWEHIYWNLLYLEGEYKRCYQISIHLEYSSLCHCNRGHRKSCFYYFISQWCHSGNNLELSYIERKSFQQHYFDSVYHWPCNWTNRHAIGGYAFGA